MFVFFLNFLSRIICQKKWPVTNCNRSVNRVIDQNDVFVHTERILSRHSRESMDSIERSHICIIPVYHHCILFSNVVFANTIYSLLYSLCIRESSNLEPKLCCTLKHVLRAHVHYLNNLVLKHPKIICNFATFA